MAKNKHIIEAKIKLDTKEYEKSMSKIKKDLGKTSDEVKKLSDNMAKSTESSNKKIILSNNNLAKSYGTLRASSSQDLEKLRATTKKVANDAEKSNEQINNSNLKLVSGTSKLRAATEADLNKIKSSFSRLGEGATQAQNSTTKSFNSIKDGITRAVGTVKGKVDELKGKVREVGTSMTASFSNNKAISTLASNISSSTNTIKSNLSSIAKKAAETGKALEDMGEKYKKAGDKITKAGDKMTKSITAPIVGTGALATTMAVEFDYSFKVLSTLLDISGKELEEYEAKLQKTAADMAVDLNEFTNATYQAISSGIDYKEAIGFVSEAVKLAKGGLMDTAGAVDTLTTILNTYGEKAGNLTQIQDKLVQTQNKGKTTVGQLGAALANVIPNANALGVSFDELLGVMAHMTASGIKTEQAGTKLRSMLDELGKSGTKSADILKQKTGKSFKELMENGKSLEDVLTMVQKEAEKSGLALSDMFGSTEAASAANSIMGNLEGYNDALKSIKDSAGVAEVTYEKVADSMKEHIKGAVVEIQSSLIDLGQKFEPLLDDIIAFAKKIPEVLDNIDFEAVIKPFLDVASNMLDVFGDLLEWFSKLDKDTQNFIAKAIMMAACLGPVISLFGKMVSGVGMFLIAVGSIQKFFESKLGIAIISAVSKMSGVIMGIVKSLWIFVKGAFVKMAAAVVPFVVAHAPVILAILAVIAVIGLLVYYWDEVKAAAVKVCDIVKEKWGQFSEWFGGIWEGVVEGAKGAWENVTNAWNGACDWFKGIWDGFVEDVTKAWEWIGQAVEVGILFISDLFGLAFDLITLPWQFIWQNLGPIVMEAFEAVCEWVQEGFNKLVEFFTPFAEIIAEVWNGLWNGLCDIVSTVFEFIVNAVVERFTAIYENLVMFGELIAEIWSFIWNGLCESFNSFIEWIVGLWNGLIGIASEIFSVLSEVISSIWTGITDTARSLWEGFTSWWSSTTSSICESVKSYLQGVIDKISSGFSSAIETAKGVWDGLWTKITGVIENIKSAVSGLVSKLKGAFNFTWSLPKPRIPQIVTSGSWSWNPPSAPRFDIVWKHDGGIFSHPTVFGNLGVGDGFKGLGAQKEAIMPIEKLPDLLGLNERKGGDFTLKIENFENNREMDIEQLVKEIGYYSRKRGLNFGI